MTYADVLLVFVLGPTIVLAATERRRVDRAAGAGLGGIALIALLYTAPWDNYLIRVGVWDYGDGRTLANIGAAPIEEYLFIALLPLLTGLWLLRAQAWTTERPRPAARALAPMRLVGIGAWLAAAVAGGAMTTTDATFYLGMILVWAAPVLALQWGFAAETIARHRRVAALGVAAPTLYLWAVDRIAIGAGVWTISDRYTIGWAPLGLPIEEAVFFLLTNLLVVQGLMAVRWATGWVSRRRGARRYGATLARRSGQPS